MEKFIEENAINFKKIRMSSPLCKLLLKERDAISNTFDGVDFYSIAFLSFCRGWITDIDGILGKFEIEEKATKGFKGNLEERWLDEADDAKRHQLLNRVFSSLFEIITANHLSEEGEEIRLLSALDESCQSDIVSFNPKNNKKYVTEIKYLGEIPDVRQLNLDAIRKGCSEVRSVSSPGMIFNYYCMRIADAVCQLEKAGIPVDERRVFLVIDSSNKDFVENTAISWLSERADWLKGSEWEALVSTLVLNEEQMNYKNTAVENYIARANEVVVAFGNRCNLELKGHDT
ncbi:MAG: hypothetical protein ABIB11_02060 [Candidatus Omnitrophota bacterium]